MSDQEQRPSREEIAKAEIGRTAIARFLARAMTVVFLATIFAVPGAEHARDIRAYFAGERTSPWPQCYDIFRSLSASARMLARTDGTLADRVFSANRVLLEEIHRYEDSLSQESLLHDCLLPPAQELLLIVGAGNEKAYVGREGWLFYRPGIDYLTGPGFLDGARPARTAGGRPEWDQPRQADPRGAILQFNEQLRRRGITLILMPTPDKAMIHPEEFSPRFDDRVGPIQNPSFQRFAREMQQGGVLLFDVSQALIDAKRRTHQPQYLRTDTHWRPEAMELTAAELREFIERNVSLPPAPPIEFVRREAEVENLGDIAVMLNLPKGQKLYPKENLRVHQVLMPRNQPWDATASADVLVLGDSFSNVYSLDAMNWGFSAGLVEQLSCELKRPLDRIVRNDDGAYATRRILSAELARGRDRLAGKKLVIWQFAARELSAGDWKLLDMNVGAPRRGGFLTPAHGEELTLSGVIRSLSRPPRPPQPYKDCLITIHLADLDSPGRDLEAREALVYVFGMRDNAWTAAATYRVGDRIRLKLRSFKDSPPGFSRLRRVPLDEPGVELEEPFWGEAVGR